MKSHYFADCSVNICTSRAISRTISLSFFLDYKCHQVPSDHLLLYSTDHIEWCIFKNFKYKFILYCLQ